MRVGVIGLGNRGPNHLKALVQIANVEIRALCDKNPDFTAGAWESNPRNMDIDLVNGGGDTRILPPSQAALAFDDELVRQLARDHA